MEEGGRGQGYEGSLALGLDPGYIDQGKVTVSVWLLPLWFIQNESLSMKADFGNVDSEAGL